MNGILLPLVMLGVMAMIAFSVYVHNSPLPAMIEALR